MQDNKMRGYQEPSYTLRDLDVFLFTPKI